MRKLLLAGAIIGLVSGTSGQAQEVYRWPAPVRTDGPIQYKYFPMGTQLMLRTTTQISTKDNKPGDRVYFEVAEALTFRGQVVVPVGSPAVGEVVRSQRNGHFGKKGKLDIRLLYVQTPSGPVRLTGHADDEGTSGTAASIATIALVSPLGFLIHGTSAHIPFGTVVKGYLAEPLQFAEQPPAPPLATVEPDNARPLPARFDPSVFGGSGSQPAAQAQIWLPEDLEAIYAVSSQPLRDAMSLGAMTALRRDDLVSLRWDEVGDLAIQRVAAKRSRGKRFRVTIPRLPQLNALLDELRTRPREAGVETVLVNSYGKSWTGDGLASSFYDARDKANDGDGIWYVERDPSTGEEKRIRKRLHDLRGTFATRLMTQLKSPLTDREIADVMGWSEQQVGDIRKRYVDDKAIVVALTRRLGQGAL